MRTRVSMLERVRRIACLPALQCMRTQCEQEILKVFILFMNIYK
jgi:hypothetical protein